MSLSNLKRGVFNSGVRTTLYRDKVNTNRLTQRQPVNIPIIRETISSWISKIDEAPKLSFETRDRSAR